MTAGSQDNEPATSKVRGPHQAMPKSCFRPREPGFRRTTVLLVFRILRNSIKFILRFHVTNNCYAQEAAGIYLVTHSSNRRPTPLPVVLNVIWQPWHLRDMLITRCRNVAIACACGFAKYGATVNKTKHS